MNKADGSVILVGFDLQGGTIATGEGPILTVTFSAMAGILNQTEVLVSFDDRLHRVIRQVMPILTIWS